MRTAFRSVTEVCEVFLEKPPHDGVHLKAARHQYLIANVSDKPLLEANDRLPNLLRQAAIYAFAFTHVVAFNRFQPFYFSHDGAIQRRLIQIGASNVCPR